MMISRRAQLIMENGTKINNMASVMSYGLMVQSMTVTTTKDKSKAMEHTSGSIKAHIMGNGIITEFRVKESIHGQMVEAIMENGKTAIWMAMEFISGQMEESMKANISKIKKLDMVFTSGLMAESILELG